MKVFELKIEESDLEREGCFSYIHQDEKIIVILKKTRLRKIRYFLKNQSKFSTSRKILIKKTQPIEETLQRIVTHACGHVVYSYPMNEKCAVHVM